jgi:hypothetical protein
MSTQWRQAQMVFRSVQPPNPRMRVHILLKA